MAAMPLSNLRVLPIHQETTGSTTPILQSWRTLRASDHVVQFYENDRALVDSLTDFVTAGFAAGEACIVIATQQHSMALERRLRDAGHSITSAQASGQFILLDAAATLAKFMRGPEPDPGLFRQTIEPVIMSSGKSGGSVRAFGEMVAILWAEGKHHGACRLEELWNELALDHPFSLLCAYQMNGFSRSADAAAFARICTHHSRVIPTESYSRIDSHDNRMREIAALQQKASALEAEIARRVEVEVELERKIQEVEDLNAHLKRAVLETHHRVKNNLQATAAMIEMQAMAHRKANAVPVHELVRLQRHVHTLAVVHDLLTVEFKESDRVQYVSAKAALDRLLPLMAQSSSGLELSYEVEAVKIPSNMCIALSLVISELVGNALKHGRSKALVRFGAQGSTATLEVCDDGPGFPDGFDIQTSANTGLSLVDSLVSTDLQGNIFFARSDNDGGSVRVTFQIPAQELVN